jgi:hypothetical protein
MTILYLDKRLKDIILFFRSKSTTNNLMTRENKILILRKGLRNFRNLDFTKFCCNNAINTLFCKNMTQTYDTILFYLEPDMLPFY